MRIRSHIVLLVVSVPLFLALTETTLWLLDVSPTFPNRFFVFNRNFDYPDVFKRDPTLFWRLRGPQRVSSSFFAGGRYEINAHGLRGPAVDTTSPGRYIAALGNAVDVGKLLHVRLACPRRQRLHSISV